MKALILFRSFHGNTRQVAEAIARQLQALGAESVVQDLRQRLPDLKGFDCAFIGAPTRMARVNWKALRVLKRLKKRSFTSRPVAVFDTYGPVPTTPEELEKSRKWIYPGAAGIMEKAARDLGLAVYEKTLRCEVKGLNGPLQEHEQDKAEEFAREFVSWMGARGTQK